MAKRMKPADVVIVGLGATGGIAALPLTKAGLDVVGLEAGPWWKTANYPMDEVRNDIRNYLGPKAQSEIPTSRQSSSDVAQPNVSGATMNGVGGSSIHYSGQSWRLRAWNFEMRSATLKRYGASYIPSKSLVEDWPFSYEELEPYYDKVEWQIGVSGQAGNVKGKINRAGNVLEDRRSREYPLPALRQSGYAALGHRAAKRLGWHPFPGPAAIHSEDWHGVSQTHCQYCGFCTSNGCMTNAKASVNLTAIPEAQKTGHLDVRPNSRVVEITVDRDGRANGVKYLAGGQMHFQPAKFVILSSFLYENIRLLLLSRSAAYPNGLSNNSGQVGQGYITHGYMIVTGVFPERINQFGPTAQQTTLDDWDADYFDHRGLGFIGGAMLGTSTEKKPIAGVQSAPATVPLWGSEWKSWVKHNFLRTAGVLGQMDVLPYEQNYLDLDPTYKDPLGFPRVRITFAPQQQEQLRSTFIIDKCTQWLKEMGAKQTWSFPYIPAVNVHAYGGARFGGDPSTSVLDAYSVSHEVGNLAVLGGAGMLNCGGHNPTETFQAMAWRTADHIVKHWRSLTV